MGSYRQYCPIARASEILAERWNPLIIRNLMLGADTFSQLARGVPAMSRSMLIKRLDELERDGIIKKAPKPDGRGHLYQLTDAGKDLVDVITTLGVWGEPII
jgi:DNA-binding HxlR family transcriptional regulator